MPLLLKESRDNVFTLTLSRGKVNAINGDLMSELSGSMDKLENDDDCRSVILTGSGSFFSFGFDIPELLDYGKEDFRGFLYKFNSLIKRLFMYPKPLLASINGHCIAGGCLMAIACDYRIMATDKSKISLNEISFGSTLFASGFEILKHVSGHRNAEKILLSGGMYGADDALGMGLVDETCMKEELSDRSFNIAREYSEKDHAAFYSLKKMSRLNTLKVIERYEESSLEEFVDIWYSPNTREYLRRIEIRK